MRPGLSGKTDAGRSSASSPTCGCSAHDLVQPFTAGSPTRAPACCGQAMDVDEEVEDDYADGARRTRVARILRASCCTLAAPPRLRESNPHPICQVFRERARVGGAAAAAAERQRQQRPGSSSSGGICGVCGVCGRCGSSDCAATAAAHAASVCVGGACTAARPLGLTCPARALNEQPWRVICIWPAAVARLLAAVGCRLSAGWWWLAAGFWLLSAGGWWRARRRQPLAAGRLLLHGCSRRATSSSRRRNSACAAGSKCRAACTCEHTLTDGVRSRRACSCMLAADADTALTPLPSPSSPPPSLPPHPRGTHEATSNRRTATHAQALDICLRDACSRAHRSGAADADTAGVDTADADTAADADRGR